MSRWMAVGVAVALVAAAWLGLAGGASAGPAPLAGLPGPAVGADPATVFGNVTALPIGIVGAATAGLAIYGFVSEIGRSGASVNGSEIVVQQVDAVSVTLQICHPDCGSPLTLTNITYRAFQAYASWTNTTPSAQVLAHFQNGSVALVPAIGIANSHVRASGGVAETFRTLQNSTLVASLEANTTYSADSQVTFSPALGVLPLQPQGIVSWRADANYTATGSWSATWSINATGPLGGIPLRPGVTHTVSDSGPLSLVGAGAGAGRFHDRTAYRLEPRFVGAPLTLVGGLAVGLALPNPFQGDLGSEWESENHVQGLVAPAQVYADPTSAELVVSTVVSFSGGVTDPSDPGSNQSLPNSTVAGAPMTSPQYSTYASCLQSSPASCPSVVSPGAPANPANSPAFQVAVVIGGVAVAAAAVAALVVGQKRRLPPARYPQAALYPPGGEGTTAGSTSASPRATEADRTEDPLDRLW